MKRRIKDEIDAKRAKMQRKLRKYVGGLKRSATYPEKLLARALNDAYIDYSFQRYLHDHERGYIVDFYIKIFNSNPLVVEVDGTSHNTPKAIRYDNKRTTWLMKHRNCHVIRFTNDEVLDNVHEVIDKILMYRPMRTISDELDTEFRRIITDY